MGRRQCSFTVIAAIALGLGLAALPAVGQQILYDNGPDGNIGYYAVNFGAAVTNSLVLPTPATVSSVTLTLYDVDDRNAPQHLKWTVSTEPFGGTVKGSGFSDLVELENPYTTKFLFFAWKMSFAIPNLDLPAGTYYLQIQDVVTRWDTWAFWAQSGEGNSDAYYEAIGPNGAATIAPVPSETFSVSGEWMPERAE
jgi:hypothetical protein